MLFSKATLLFGNNWKVMLKALFCQVLILAFVAALCVLIFGGLVDDIVQVFTAGQWSKFLSETISGISDGNFDGQAFADGLVACINQTRDTIESISTTWNRVEISYIICIVLLLAYRMLISSSDISAGYQVHEFMTSNAVRPFSWYFVKKFTQSLKFVSLQMVITVPLDMLVLYGGIGSCILMLVGMRWWAIIPATVIMLVLYAMRLSLFAFWLPALVSEDMGVRKSLQKGFSVIPYRFWHVFWKTFVLVLVMAVISILSVLYIKMPILKLAVGIVPNLVLFFWMKCINFVEYFEATSRPYFVRKVDVEGTERFNKKMERRARKHRKAE